MKPCSRRVQVEEQVDEAALERRAGAPVDGEPGAGDLGAGGEVDHAQRLADLPVGLAPEPSGVRAAGGSPQVRTMTLALASPTGTSAIGRVGDAQQQLLERGLDLVDDARPARVDARAQLRGATAQRGYVRGSVGATLDGRAHALARPACAPRAGCPPRPIASRRSRVEGERLVDRLPGPRPWRWRPRGWLRIVAQPLDPDAHRLRPRSEPRPAARTRTNGVEAGQQPAGARPVAAAQERQVDGRERIAGGDAVCLRCARR